MNKRVAKAKARAKVLNYAMYPLKGIKKDQLLTWKDNSKNRRTPLL